MQTNLHRGKSAANVVLLSTAAATVEGRLMPKRHPARYFFQSSKTAMETLTDPYSFPFSVLRKNPLQFFLVIVRIIIRNARIVSGLKIKII